jgi:hypothetical protein
VTQIITDAELVNKYAAEISQEPELKVETRAPAGPEVKLPGGLVVDGQLVTTAEVRELTGLDEEAIAKAATTGKALNLLLQRGLVKVGSKDATAEDLDNLLSGDRDAILLGIRKITFGEDVKYSMTCPNCTVTQDITINLTDDVPVKKLENQADRTWRVETKRGYATVSLPTGATQKKLFENVDKSAAEINTMLLAGCVLSVNDIPSMGASTVLNIGIGDRAKIIDEVLERNPGPRLGEVTTICQACGETISFPLSLVDLFRI